VGAATGEPKKVSFEVGALSRTEVVFQGILQANDAGRLHGFEEVARWREGFGGSHVRDGSGQGVASPQADLSTDSLEEVIRRRGSARVFARGFIRAEVLAAILARCTVGVPTDYAPGGAHLAEPYLIANGFFSPDAEGKSCMLVVAVGESPRLRRA